MGLFQILLVLGLAAILFRPGRRFLKTTAGLWSGARSSVPAGVALAQRGPLARGAPPTPGRLRCRAL